jgi:diguanylate cyclase (GGDEF)-like protein/PAS domain S-box-containing protein
VAGHRRGIATWSLALLDVQSQVKSLTAIRVGMTQSEHFTQQFGSDSYADSRLAALLSITGRMDGFLYRCRNDLSFTMLYISYGILTVSGYPASDFEGNRVRSFSSLIHPDDLGQVYIAVSKALEMRSNWNIDYRLLAADGREVWVREIGGGAVDEAGELGFLEGFVVDINDRKGIEDLNAALMEELKAANAKYERLTAALQESERQLLRHLSDAEMSRASLEAQAQTNVELAEELSAQKKELEEEKQRSDYAANHDLLTELPNRRAFQVELKAMLEQSQAAGTSIGLLFIDLDKFKDVNDTLGHEAGDALLQQVAGNLRAILRKGDFVARLGGDEFAFLVSLDTHEPRATASRVAERVLERLQILVPSAKGMIAVGCTVGVAVSPGDADDPQALMVLADRLMYVGKKRGRNRLITIQELESE